MSAKPIIDGLSAGSPQAIYEDSTTQHHAVGTRGTLKNRTFHYSECGAAGLSVGKLAMMETLAAPGDVVDMAVGTMAIGDKTLTGVTTNGTTHAIAENEYSEGFLFVNDDTGEGYTFLVDTNEAIAGSGGTGSVTLYDPLVVAFGAGATVTLLKNPWKDIVVAVAAHAHFAIGVPQCAVAASAWAWVQTWGPVAIWDDATTAVGASLQSGTTEGQIEIGDGAAQPLGVQLNVGADGEYRGHYLQIAP